MGDGMDRGFWGLMLVAFAAIMLAIIIMFSGWGPSAYH
jgi:hypothetical protein